MTASMIERSSDRAPARRAFRKPFVVPDSLDDLHGPSSGNVTLPIDIYWGEGDRTFEASDMGGVVTYYPDILREANLDELTLLVNSRTLRAVWPDMLLPRWLRQAWEERFAELRQRPKRSWK